MNWKKLLTAFVVVYLVGMIYNYLVHGMLLMDTYRSLQDVWRPEEEMNNLMWVQFITGLFISFFLVYIFAKGYEGKGIMEGVRYGLVMWAFVSIPISFGNYMILPIPYGLVWKWLLADLVIFIISGVIIASIYKPAQSTSAT